MSPCHRRAFLRRSLAATALAVTGGAAPAGRPRLGRVFTLDLVPGMIGVQAGYADLLEPAARLGFESIAPDPGYLAGLSDDQNAALIARLSDLGLKHGAAGLPVEFRRDEASFRDGLEALPPLAAALRRAGATRVGTYIMPNHAELTYSANFKQHADRLRQVTAILDDHGLRFGLEYVGPKTLWTAKRHSFIHSMAEMKELIAAIDRPHVGFVLDSWHWYTAGETLDDLASLTNDQVIACDLNDAPAGIPVDQQIDNRRELPGATGVIDLAGFLGALVAMGYNGPVRAEPFNAALNALDDAEALATTAAAMRKAVAPLEAPTPR